jgi:membrane protein DedA with SNARE-associated domain
MTEFLIEFFVKIIEAGGYAGIVLLMTLESMIAPVPSEAVMPFAGFLWFLGKMSFLPIVLWSILGSLVGSLISYYIGYRGGEPIVRRYGKYIFLNEEHLEATKKFFNKHGGKTIFIGRFIPVIRHFISIPAGAGKMNVFQFVVYTFFGAGIWNAFLVWAGYALAENWMTIRKYGEAIDVVLIIFIVSFAVYYIYNHFRKNLDILR